MHGIVPLLESTVAWAMVCCFRKCRVVFNLSHLHTEPTKFSFVSKIFRFLVHYTWMKSRKEDAGCGSGANENPQCQGHGSYQICVG